MARYTDETPISAAMMREYADALERLAATHRLFAEWIENNGLEPLHVQNFKSASGAIDGLLAFLGACGRSVAEGLMSKDAPGLATAFAKASTEPEARLELLSKRRRRDAYLAKIKNADAIEEQAEAVAEKLIPLTATSGQKAGHKKKEK